MTVRRGLMISTGVQGLQWAVMRLRDISTHGSTIETQVRVQPSPTRSVCNSSLAHLKHIKLEPAHGSQLGWAGLGSLSLVLVYQLLTKLRALFIFAGLWLSIT